MQHGVGKATLNAESTLNGLTLTMAALLAAQLDAWATDRAVAMVVLCGAGSKAFCAGGDLHSLYQAMVRYRQSASADILECRYAREFFEVEYRLDYRIHTYPKPVLCWGDGIVMGGGIGLMAGASQRVVTERSRLAMPEVTVGLYPDVGASWLLPRVPGQTNLFLALTGAPLQGSDAVFAGFADHVLPSSERDALLTALTHTAWTGIRAADERLLAGAMRRSAAGTAAPAASAEGPLRRHFGAIRAACDHASLDDVMAAIEALSDTSLVDGAPDPWLVRARDTMRAGSPLSRQLCWEMQRRAQTMSLAQAFQLELVVSMHCAAHGDFAEGIRALLIDKDKQPRWPAHHDVAAFFAEPAWEESPLRDLERPPPS